MFARSVINPIAYMLRIGWYVRFAPLADIAPTSEASHRGGPLSAGLLISAAWVVGPISTGCLAGFDLRIAAWIVEKFQSWTQNRGAIEDAVSRDDLLSNIMLYWATGAIGSSFWPYYARMHSPGIIPDGERIRVPTGYAEFPGDFLHLPRSWAERTYGNIQRWTKMEKGGHFAALEQPELLAREIREFFRPLR